MATRDRVGGRRSQRQMQPEAAWGFQTSDPPQREVIGSHLFGWEDKEYDFEHHHHNNMYLQCPSAPLRSL